MLVRTWNIEGYAPLDEDETLAQLSYIACAMLHEGCHQIGHGALLSLLHAARKELEAELQFARISPAEFIQRIEYRSSLLVLAGHHKTRDGMEPIYEFRHLTFQEYLAARGCVEEQYPRRNAGRSLTEFLEPYLGYGSWQEVIPLAAVLAGRKAETLIALLICACDDSDKKQRARGRPAQLLYRCICDEVQVGSATLQAALRQLTRYQHELTESYWIQRILRSKFGAMFKQVTEEEYLKSEDLVDYLNVLLTVSYFSWFNRDGAPLTHDTAAKLLAAMDTGGRMERIEAALVCVQFAEQANQLDPDVEFADPQIFERLSAGLVRLLFAKDVHCAIPACWALDLIASRELHSEKIEPRVLLALYRCWRESAPRRHSHYAASALAAQMPLPRNSFSAADWGEDCDEFLRQVLERGPTYRERLAAAVVAWYRRRPWTKTELVRHFRATLRPHPPAPNPKSSPFLEEPGEDGLKIIAKWRRMVER